jgi:hypothetical protein
MARILSTPCQRAAELIARTLYEVDITLADANDNGVLDRKEVEPLKPQIVAIYRDCLQDDIELVVSLSGGESYEQIVADALWTLIDSTLWDAVDSELWALQISPDANAWVDDAIDRMQAREVAA